MVADYKLTVNRMVANTEKMALAVLKTAIESLIVDEMAKTKIDGGWIPVNTGFLAQSGQAALNSPPVGESVKPADAHPLQFHWEPSQLIVVLKQMKIDDTLVFGWTAEYAEEQNRIHKWVEKASVNWQTHVDAAIRRMNE